MWRSGDDGDDDGSAAAVRLARVVGLPPDPDDPPAYPWDPPAAAPDGAAFGSAGRGGGRGAGLRDAGSDGGGFGAAPAGSGGARSALAAFDPGRRGVRVLAVVAGLVVCVAAFLAWRSRPQVTPAPQVAVASQAAPASSPPALYVVSVTGKVTKPGLVKLPAGSRVADAIDAAGGPVPGTDLTGVNLARKIVDGEMIAVGITPPPGAAPAGNPGAGPGGGAGGPVNLNTATATELQNLPGIGEVLAQRIIEYRDRHGGFHAVTDLRQVEGIGDAKFQQLKDRVTV